jgi:hypothetical protein
MRAAIEGDVKDLSAGIALAKQDIRSFGKGVPGWVKPVGTAMVATGAVVTGALTKMIFDAGKLGDELDKMSLRTGIAVEPLSELSYAVKISGSDVNALETSVRFLNRRMDEAGQGIGIAVDAFERLGVEVLDADGSMRDSVTVMMEVADGIVGLTEESERGALAMDIFGARSGPQLLPLLKQGSAGIRELRQTARDLGLTMKTESALAAAEFTDRVTDIKESAKMAAFDLGMVFLPAITDATEAATGAVSWFSRLTDSQQEIVGWGAAASGGFLSVSGAGLLVVGMLPKLVSGFKLLNISSIGAGFGLAAAGATAFGSSLWALKRVTDALLDPTTELRGQLKGLSEVAETNYPILTALQNRMEELVSQGVAPGSIEMSSFNANLQELGEELGIIIGPTMLMQDVITVLEKSMSRTSGQAAALKGKIKELEEGEDAGKAATDAFNEALAKMNKTVEEGDEGWTTDNVKEWFSEAGFLAQYHTSLVGGEYEKRSVLDDEHLSKIQRNAQRKLGIASDAIQKESGMIQDFFDWEVIAAAERSIKLQSQRANQYAEEARLFDEYLALMVSGEERMMRVKEQVAAKDLAILNEGHAAGVRLAEEEAAERTKFFDFFLQDATRQVGEAFNIQAAFHEKTREQAEASYQEGMAAIDATYQNFSQSFAAAGIDLVKLDVWRAEQMLKVEQALSDAKLEELDDYYGSYEDRVRSHEEAFSTSGGLFGGISAYGDMAQDYKQLLTDPIRDAVFGLTDAIQQIPLPSTTSPPTGGGITLTPHYGGGGTEFHFHIENLYGADEAFLNTFAEDIARRIREQNIQI